jgi:DinB family protein
MQGTCRDFAASVTHRYHASMMSSELHGHRSPDPVLEPKAYQDHLVGLAGNEDPAEIQAGTPGRIRELVARAADDVRRRPADGEWSVLECIAHIADAELVASGRYRWILAHDEPELFGYDQDRWIQHLHAPVEDAAELLAFFEPMRAANLALWGRTPEADRERVGIHRERGPESYRLTFVLMAGHDRFHLAQAERALAAVRS